MSRIAIILILLCLCNIAMPVFASSSETDLHLKSWTSCVEDGMPSKKQSSCLRARISNANRLVEAALTDLAKKNPTIGRTERSAQNPWLQYKKNHCKALGLINEGGSLQEINQAACTIEATLLRAQELRKIVESI